MLAAALVRRQQLQGLVLRAHRVEKLREFERDDVVVLAVYAGKGQRMRSATPARAVSSFFMQASMSGMPSTHGNWNCGADSLVPPLS